MSAAETAVWYRDGRWDSTCSAQNTAQPESWIQSWWANSSPARVRMLRRCGVWGPGHRLGGTAGILPAAGGKSAGADCHPVVQTVGPRRYISSGGTFRRWVASPAQET